MHCARSIKQHMRRIAHARLGDGWSRMRTLKRTTTHHLRTHLRTCIGTYKACTHTRTHTYHTHSHRDLLGRRRELRRKRRLHLCVGCGVRWPAMLSSSASITLVCSSTGVCDCLLCVAVVCVHLHDTRLILREKEEKEREKERERERE